jgi:ribosomal protein S18 acetylase RimI-like enzyme/predicted ester cyclase
MGTFSLEPVARLDDAAAVHFAQPAIVVVADEPAAQALVDLAASYYGFWNNGSTALFEATVSPAYVDQTLPAGRSQGPKGLADAGAAFFEAFPDGRVHVQQQMLVGDRIVSHLRITGHFTGQRDGVQGAGQAINYLATDIMRVADNRIVENWHVEDHETLYRQLGSPAPVDTIELRPVAEEDVAHVVSLLNRAYRGTGVDEGWTTEAGLINGDRENETMLRQELVQKPDAMLMVWKPTGKVEGCVWLEPAADGTWYLGSLAIDPRLQNRRLGRQLLSAAESWIQQRGGRAIKMTVIETRGTLISWYERRGYRKTGETIPFPYSETQFGIPREAGLLFVTLSKAIPAAAAT